MTQPPQRIAITCPHCGAFLAESDGVMFRAIGGRVPGRVTIICDACQKTHKWRPPERPLVVGEQVCYTGTDKT